MRDLQQLVELTREECVQLLTEHTLGRLAVNPPGWAAPPVLRPVNYAFDPDSSSIVFRSSQGSKFTALLLAGEAAFEIDGFDQSDGAWSVVVHGCAEEVTSAPMIRRLSELDVQTWAPAEKPHWIRIRPTHISGRRIRA